MSEKTRKAEAGYQRLIRMPKPGTKQAMFSIRISEADRDAIAALAIELGVTQSTLVTRKVLGRMTDALEVRLLRAEARVARLERKTYGIALSDDEIDRMALEEGL